MTEPLSIDSDPKAYLSLHAALDEPACDAALTEREREVRRRTRDVVAHDIAPIAAHLDATHTFAHDGVQALAAENLCGLVFPEELGGTGDSNVAYALATEEVTVGCAATSLVYVTQMHSAYPILIAGTDEQKHAYIPGLLDGNRYGSLGITEPDAGSDVSSLTTTATPGPDGWTLTGQKTFITTGDRADVIICFATVDRSLGRRGITAFVVESSWKGVDHGTPFDKMGMHGSSTAELFFDRVALPSTSILGEEGNGWSVVMRSVVKSRISAGAQGIGLARAAYARTLAALTRLHGARLSDEQTFALAGIRSRILQGRLLLHSVARLIDADPGTTPGQVAMMKQACTDLGFDVALECMRILGPYGDLTDLGVERCLRDAAVTRIYDGTNEIQRLLVGRETARDLARLGEEGENK